MTTEDDVIRYGGVGYRLSCIAHHRGSNGEGCMDVRYFYDTYKNRGLTSGAALSLLSQRHPLLSYEDIYC